MHKSRLFWAQSIAMDESVPKAATTPPPIASSLRQFTQAGSNALQGRFWWLVISACPLCHINR